MMPDLLLCPNCGVAQPRQPWLPPEDVETLRKMERFCVTMCYEELAIPLRAILAKVEGK